MTMDKEACSKQIVYDRWGHSSPCGHKVTTHEEGKPWCTIHAPSYAVRKRAEREARLDAQRAVDRKRWQEESRNKDRLALYPELVEALWSLLKEARELEPHGFDSQEAADRYSSPGSFRVAQAILAQAEALEKGE